MPDSDIETRLAALERKAPYLDGQIEALRIALAQTLALLRGTAASDVQIVLVKSIEVLALAHPPLPDEHHTRGFHDELRTIAGLLNADLSEN